MTPSLMYERNILLYGLRMFWHGKISRIPHRVKVVVVVRGLGDTHIGLTRVFAYSLTEGYKTLDEGTLVLVRDNPKGLGHTLKLLHVYPF